MLPYGGIYSLQITNLSLIYNFTHMNIFSLLHNDILTHASKLAADPKDLVAIALEIPKDAANGDLSTNAAMILARALKRNPRDVATELQNELQQLDYIQSIDIAGPGFINFTIKPSKWHESVAEILSQGSSYGSSNIGAGVRVNIEYTSANPTGPMHIGHARGTVYGDAMARLLTKCGYEVTKEYYINDAGSQVADLARSAFLRYKEAVTGELAVIPQGLYPGEYLIPTGAKLAEKYGDKLLGQGEDEYLPLIKKFAIEEMLGLIKADLLELGVEHDVFTSEQSLHDAHKIEDAIAKLKKADLVYEGVLPPPKGKEQEGWEPQPQLLFKSTEFGDDQDRVLQKHNGGWTYFAGDVGYALDKISRKFNNLICVLGVDHSGHVKRIEAAIKALSEGATASEVKLCQMVNYVENGEPIKMSKRSGNFTTVRDVVREVGKDIVRFMMLTRKNDTILDFDLIKVKEQSRDNPVFYVQYAFVRAKSVLANAKMQHPQIYEMFVNGSFDLSLISSKEELELMKTLASWARVVEGAAKHFEPHRIAFYLQSLVALFHSLWNLGKENNNYRFIVESNPDLTAARLALLSALCHVIYSGFDIIGVDTVEKM